MKKLLVFAVLLLVAFGLAIYKLYDSLVASPQKQVQASPGKAVPPERKELKGPTTEAKPSVQYIRETLSYASDAKRRAKDRRASNGLPNYRDSEPDYVRTDRNLYCLGDVSEFGMVTAIRIPAMTMQLAVVKCEDGNGRTVYVVCGPPRTDEASSDEEHGQHAGMVETTAKTQ